MPKLLPPAHRLVVALAYDGLCAFEFGIVAEIFGLARPEMGPDWYRFLVCAEYPGRLSTNAGVAVAVDPGLEALDDAGMIVIPGWRSDGPPPSARLCEALRRAHDRGARLVTICSGAFLLAAAGLVDGRRVTTHWRYADRLRLAHPGVTVDANVLYVDDGAILTSAGSAAGIDLLLHIVRRDFGADAANSVARRMVVAAHRNGGQAQFIERPVAARPDNRLAAVLDVIRGQLTHGWTVADMAARAAMSTRTFVRRFRDATGFSPGAWLTVQRLAVARELLETTRLPMDRVAEQSGLGSAANLRLHFVADTGIPPAIYRKQFAREAGPIGPERDRAGRLRPVA